MACFQLCGTGVFGWRFLVPPNTWFRGCFWLAVPCFKIVNKVYDEDCTQDIFQMREDNFTRGNRKKTFKTHTRLNLRKYTFLQRVINNWNNLPEWVVNAKNVMYFEKKHDIFWINQEHFLFKTHIVTRSDRYTVKSVDGRTRQTWRTWNASPFGGVEGRRMLGQVRLG